MATAKEIILDTLPEGILKILAEDLEIAPPEDYGIFPRAIVRIALPNLSLRIERFVETNHWWIADDIYDYYTVEALEEELIQRIARSIEWKHIENSEFTFDVDDLLPDYGKILKFPIRPNGVEGLAEILFQITEQRDYLSENTALIVYETGSHEYAIENRLRSYSDDVYLTIYKKYENGPRVYLSNIVVCVAYLEDIISKHISDHMEWVTL